MQFWGHNYTKNIPVFSLKFKFQWMSLIYLAILDGTALKKYLFF